jgi:hypothetical protein
MMLNNEPARAQAHTCECPDGPPSLVSAYWASPSVFLGVLADIDHDVETHERRYRFRVTRIFRGPEHQFVVVRTPDAPASCGVTFRRYVPYVVYADGEENGTLSAFACTSRIRGGVARAEREVERLESLLSAHARHGARP